MYQAVIDYFWRIAAIFTKEFNQLRRDRLTCAMIVITPLVQVILYGYAINTTPKHMPTAVVLQEDSDLGRSIIRAFQMSDIFRVTHKLDSSWELDGLLESGTVLFAIEIPSGFERAVRRGDVPRLLFVADATDPIAANAAISSIGSIAQSALRNERGLPELGPPLFEVRSHARYNPAAVNAINIVPGLVGTILTLTMVAFTALSVTREKTRGSIELLLSLPISPMQIMLGKILPYVVVGAVQASLIISSGVVLFGMPVAGSLGTLALLTSLFIMTNLAVGYAISSFAKTEVQAGQLCTLFAMPNILLSGFLFPFTGMPAWAQAVGELLPLTHYLRIIRSVMLKGASLPSISSDAIALSMLMVVCLVIPLAQFRRTLD